MRKGSGISLGSTSCMALRLKVFTTVADISFMLFLVFLVPCTILPSRANIWKRFNRSCLMMQKLTTKKMRYLGLYWWTPVTKDLNESSQPLFPTRSFQDEI